MELSLWGYSLLILSLTNVLCLVLALVRRRWDHLEVLIISLFLFSLGFSSEFQFTELIFCFGSGLPFCL